MLPVYVILSLAALFVYWCTSYQRRRSPLPPGPRDLPLVGNILNFPSLNIWETFTHWKSQYGWFEVILASSATSYNTIYY